MTGKLSIKKPLGTARTAARAAVRGTQVPAAQAAPLSPLAAALRVFDKAADALELGVEARLRLLNLGRSKYFELRSEADPVLDVDRRDRLGYFLAIYELSGRLVGAPVTWLKAANRAPLFAGKPPLVRILGGRMEDLIATLTYLKGTYGGWA